MYRILYSDTLSHHGILGMKWGQRQGPPYPLDAGDHSASERKAGWRSSLSKGPSGSSKNRFSAKAAEYKATAKEKWNGLSDKQKTAIKIGAAVAATGLAIYAGYKISDALNEKAAIKAGLDAYNRTVADKKAIANLIENGKSMRSGANAATQQSYTVGNQHYEWTNYEKHPELVPEHLKGSSNTIKDASFYSGETEKEAYNRAYRSVRRKKR